MLIFSTFSSLVDPVLTLRISSTGTFFLRSVLEERPVGLKEYFENFIHEEKELTFFSKSI